uniref:Uncharacterized protein n=1 Tax=Romanomermis culicivorax TaxID=13658 RepID=A0A915KKF3_ROMCU
MNQCAHRLKEKVNCTTLSKTSLFDEDNSHNMVEMMLSPTSPTLCPHITSYFSTYFYKSAEFDCVH